MRVRTRFAPSPTGFLHVGGVRTALFAYLVAKKNHGDFILRIEDTDKAREVEGSEKHIVESLRWLGLEPDEGPGLGGEAGPYKQSQRLDMYKQWGEKLLGTKRAYVDQNSPEELEELRSQAKEAKKPFLFRNHRPKEFTDWDGTKPLRFKSEPNKYSWKDEVLGNLEAGPEVIDDFIIIKSDGFPTYNFAHVVDDHLMQISHVIRSQEFLPSVPKYLNLYDALGITWPKLATLPYVMGVDGKKKLSKRDGAKDILDYKNQGFLPEALLNFLATLGWNDGTEQEIFALKELIDKFELGRVHRGGAHFDEDRLTWMNGNYIRQMPTDVATEQADDFWPEEAKDFAPNYKQQVLETLKERLKYFAELPELSRFFFVEPKIEEVIELYKNPIDKQLKPGKLDDYYQMLNSVYKKLEDSDFSVNDVTDRLNKQLASLGTKPGVLFPLIRIALAGKQSTPEIFSTIHVLGKKRGLERLKMALVGLEKTL